MQNIRDLAALVGKGSVKEMLVPGGEDIIPVTTLELPPEDLNVVVPILPVVGREPLEALKKSAGEEKKPSTPKGPAPIPPVSTPPIPKEPTPVPAEGKGIALAPGAPVESLPVSPAEAVPLAVAAGVKESLPKSGSNSPKSEGTSVESTPPSGPRSSRPERTSASENFFKTRGRYESDEAYYGKFMRFAKGTLGLSEKASLKDVLKAGRKWTNENHPDKQASGELTEDQKVMMKSLNELRMWQKKAKGETVQEEQLPDKDGPAALVEEVLGMIQSTERAGYREMMQGASLEQRQVETDLLLDAYAKQKGLSSQDTASFKEEFVRKFPNLDVIFGERKEGESVDQEKITVYARNMARTLRSPGSNRYRTYMRGLSGNQQRGEMNRLVGLYAQQRKLSREESSALEKKIAEIYPNPEDIFQEAA